MLCGDEMTEEEEKDENSVDQKMLRKDYRGLPPEYPDEKTENTKEGNED